MHPFDREVLARHPTKPLGIKKLADGEDAGRLQVVDLRTGKLLGRPLEAASISWCMAGEELLLLRQAEDEFTLERLSWPEELLVLRSAPLPFSSAWDVVAAPGEPYAAVLWIDQGESGYAIIDLGTLEVIESAGYSTPSMLLKPAFSPDGRLFAGFAEEEPAWCTPIGECLEERTPLARVGTVVIALAGSWDYLEVPLMLDVGLETTLDALCWPRRDDGLGCSFVSDRRFEVRLPDGRPRILDVEELRTSPKWLAERARQQVSQQMEREAEQNRLEDIARHNAASAKVANKLYPRDLTCPHCGASGESIRYHPGTPQERALFVCSSCGRSFGPL